MITKVYKEFKIPIKKECHRTVTKYKDTWIYPNKTRGYCGRCGSYYDYGSNKKDPEKCPRCTCVDCGVSLFSRVKTTNVGNKLTRCYRCWYYREFGRYPLYDRGYEITYNHRFASLGKGELKKVPCGEETITEYKDDFDIKHIPYNPKRIEYNSNNKVFYNKLNLKDVINYKFSIINQDDIDKDFNWYGCKDINNISTNLLKEPQIEKRQIFSIKEIPFNDFIVSEEQKLEEFNDVVGFYPNVPAFIQGHPLSMYNNKRVNVVKVDKCITLFINLATDSTTHYTQYKSRGIMIYSLINHILNSYKNVNETIKLNIKLYDASFIDGETIIQFIEIPCIKTPCDETDGSEIDKIKKTLYNLLTNIAFFRVVLLDNKLKFIKDNNLSDKWNDGLGFVIKNNNLKEILNLSRNDLIIGSPEDMNIGGLYPDDDMCNFLNSLDLFDEYRHKYISCDFKDLTIKKVIEERKIQKLIHVTNKKNVESIMKNGLLSIQQLDENNIEYHFNDNLRLDNKRDAICLSVSNVNNFLFKSFQKRYKENEYVVLEIDPKILFDESVKREYYDYNAASRFSQRSNTNMEIMFKDRMRRKAAIHTRLGKKSYEPTSTQAEILYFGKIDPKYIINQYDLEKLPSK